MAASAACRSPPRGSEGTGRTRARAGFAGPRMSKFAPLCADCFFVEPAVPAASAFGPMETRVRPTSRGRARCVSFRMGRRWEQTASGPRAGAVRLRRVGRRCLALPGKGRCRGAGATLFALRAKALQSGAPDLWRITGESRVSKRFPHQGSLPARRGAEPSRVAPQKMETHVPPQMERALLPATPSASSSCGKRGALQARLTAIAFSRRTSGACTQHRLPSPAKSQRFALPAPVSFPNPSRRENGGLCPRPLKGPDP